MAARRFCPPDNSKVIFQERVSRPTKTRGLPYPAVNFLFVQSHIRRPERNILINRFLKQLVFRILKHQAHMEPDGMGDFRGGPDILPRKYTCPSVGRSNPLRC